MYGELSDIIGEPTANVGFRYKISGTSTWTTYSAGTLSSIGDFSGTTTVTSGETYYLQTYAIDQYNYTSYGVVKIVEPTLTNYYNNQSDAVGDGVIVYWPLEESGGTDTIGVEKTGSGNDLTAYNGVTIGSDGIRHKRIFGTSDYMESSYGMDTNND